MARGGFFGAGSSAIAGVRSRRPRRYPFDCADSPSEGVRLRQAVLESLEGSGRHSQRLVAVQQLCADAILQRRNGPECFVELPVVNGYGGENNWDVASIYATEPALVVSFKTMGRSYAKNVINRLTDMQGELLGLRQALPDAVAGYLMIIDADEARLDRGIGKHSERSIAEAIGARCLSSSVPGAQHYNAGCVLVASKSRGTVRATQAPGLLTFADFLDELTADWMAASSARVPHVVRPFGALGGSVVNGVLSATDCDAKDRLD